MSYQRNGYGQSKHDALSTTGVSMRLSNELVDRLNSEASCRNISRTSVVEHALREYFGIDEPDGVSVLDRVSDLEQRMTGVEQTLFDDRSRGSAKHMRSADD